MMRITPFSLAAAVLSFSALVPFSALAGQSYTPPKAEFELVKAPPALNKFLEKARDTAQAESGPDQPKHLAALFADDVQIIAGLEAGDFKLQKLDAAKSKLDDCVLEHFRCALGFLNRHGGHRREAVGIFFQELFDALVVDAAPALGLLAF